MTNGSGKHPKKKPPVKQDGKGAKKPANALARERLTKNLPKPEKPAP